MNKDTINIVTSFSPKGWETYAKKMIDSVVKFMADDLHLTAYYHDFTDEQIKEFPKSNKITFKNLNKVDEMITYREEMKLHDGTEDGKMPYNWRLDAIKWCHKVYALTDFSFKLVEKSVQAGWVVWLDADIILKKPVNKQDLFGIIPLGSELVHLGRKDVDYSETSFMAFNLNTVPPLDLLGDMRGLYNSHEVLSYREWHDGFIFERLFNIYGAHGLKKHSLTPDVRGLDAFNNSPLADYFEHFKGNRKDLLSDKTTPDVVGPKRYKQLADVIRHYKFSRILETGTWNGGRAIEMALAAFDNVDKVYYEGYDLFEDADEFTDRIEMNTKPHNLYEAVNNRLKEFKAFVKEKMNKDFEFKLVKGDTRVTLKEQKDFDIAYLDGGHSLATVQHDYNMTKNISVVVFDDYFTKDDKGKEVVDVHKGTNKVFDALNKKIRKKVLPSSDPVKGGGITHLAVVINKSNLGDLPQSLNHVPIIVKPKDCMPTDYIRNNIKNNVQSIKKWLIKARPHGEILNIVSGGPSFLKYKDYLKSTQSKIMCVKHSLPMLLKEGITPWACNILDPRPIDGTSTHGIVRKELFNDIPKETIFFVSSMTDISVVKYLKQKGARIIGWNAYSDAIIEKTGQGNKVVIPKELGVPEDTVLLTGGTCAAMRAISVGHTLGFRNFKLYGFDCSVPEPKNKDELDSAGRKKYLHVTTNDKKFWTTGELLAMAQDCEKLFQRQDVDMHMEMYGEGSLVSELWKTGGRKEHPEYENTLFNND